MFGNYETDCNCWVTSRTSLNTDLIFFYLFYLSAFLPCFIYFQLTLTHRGKCLIQTDIGNRNKKSCIALKLNFLRIVVFNILQIFLCDLSDEEI